MPLNYTALTTGPGADVHTGTSPFHRYNIPSKMLYDPAPLNDPTDPGWDMSAYAAFDNGAQSYTFGRRLQSATEADWRNRMVFYPGDERAFYQGLTGTACDPLSSIYDPACRTARRTHREVAYSAYGTYRRNCTYIERWNAHRCTAASLKPARLIIESLDSDHTSRSLTPVAIATGGYVDLINAGQDHQKPKDCGGYGCLSRLMTFHTTVAVGRNYDIAFTGDAKPLDSVARALTTRQINT